MNKKTLKLKHIPIYQIKSESLNKNEKKEENELNLNIFSLYFEPLSYKRYFEFIMSDKFKYTGRK